MLFSPQGTYLSVYIVYRTFDSFDKVVTEFANRTFLLFFYFVKRFS